MTNVLARTGVLGKHQPTLVALDDLPGDRHPEPGTLRELAGASVEAVEDPVPILVGDPGTLIADCYPGPALGGDGDGSASSASRTALDSKFDTARSREAGTARQSEVDLKRPLGGQQRVLGRDVARQTGEVDVAVDVRG